MFFRPDSYDSISNDLYASIVYVVVLAFGDTALNFLPIILPISSDFPEFTGPINPTFKA
jgi:hypothetical protein